MIECVSCRELKPREAYNKAARKANGLNSYCKNCQSKKNKAWIKANKESRKAYEKSYKDSNKERYRRQKQLWDSENFEHRQSYRKLNQQRYTAHAVKRYVRKKFSQPTYLTPAQLEEIENLYWLARDLKSITGEVYHVDHIVPLQGKTVCGLHVPWNLQVLPADINIRKSNSFTEE